MALRPLFTLIRPLPPLSLILHPHNSLSLCFLTISTFSNFSHHFQVSQEKNSSIEYLRLIVGALKLVQEGDLEAINSLKLHAVAAVAEITRWE